MSTLKCNHCNIVIDEMLSYIQNKISIIDDESLVRICVSAFTSEEIKVSKTLLFESLPSGLRNINRKNKGKENRDLNDIISLFKRTDPDVIPVFVSRQLEKLPPVTFDHLDVTRLLKDLTLLQTEVNTIKASYVTVKQLQKVQDEVQNMKYSSLLNMPSNLNINTKRGAYLNSGPMGLSHHDDQTCNTESDKSNLSLPGTTSVLEFSTPKYRNIKISKNNKQSVSPIQCQVKTDATDNEALHKTGSPPTPLVAGGGSSIQQEIETCKQQLRRSALDNYQNQSMTGHDNGWTKVVKRKKAKYRFIGERGQATVTGSGEKFRAAEKKVPIFISNIHKDVTDRDIISYVHKKTGESVFLEKINIKQQFSHNAYKFFVAESKLPVFLNDKLWPQGIIFRRFVHFKQRYSNRETSGDGRTKLVNGETPI